jgi:Ca2+-binding RTX toxin-like protein
MRPLGLALLALALMASPASAAVIDIEEHFCGCDPSSGDEDTRLIVVTAAPGERNVVTVERTRRGIVIRDAGAPLSGRCRLTRSGDGRFCGGDFDGVDVLLGDGDDTLTHGVGGSVEGGPGDDSIHATGGNYQLSGGPGADLLDATGSAGASVSYADHTEGVTVRLNGLADDGAVGEGDNVLGAVTGISGGGGDDRLEAGPTASGLFGAGGNDVLVGSPQGDTIDGGEGNDGLSGGDGNDHLTGGAGTDDLSGGAGRDEASYAGGTDPLRLSIGDGPNDGAAGEGDNIREDIEDLAGGRAGDVLIGDAGANRLIAFGGEDVLRGGAGPDELLGWGDGDELDAGSGRDRVQAGSLDRPLLRDGEADRLNCRRHAPAIEADPIDVLSTCAPNVAVRARSRVRSGSRVALVARCPEESTVPCQGRLWVNAFHGQRVSRRISFGPIDPGDRATVRVHIAAGIRRGTCLLATTRTRRGDGLETVTVSRSAIACLPV